MITVEQAFKLIEKHTTRGEISTIEVAKSLGLCLAEDIISPINMPPFRQSAMDGYAICLDKNILQYKLIGEISAGTPYLHYNLKKGEAVRIFTGAAVPSGANTVVKQEVAINNGSEVSFSEILRKGDNIRAIGEQTKKGDLTLLKNTTLTAAAVGFLYSLGINQISVYKKPNIAVIVTGDELSKAGFPLKEGKIYESNSFMLSAALIQLGYQHHSVIAIKDTFEETRASIKNALKNSDVLILSGGISVGDYDFVGKALDSLGVQEIFYKVKQKPGKPLYFGKINNKYIFALPGNPAASLTSFYIYVTKALSKITGVENKIKTIYSYLPVNYNVKGSMAQFLKAQINTKQEGQILEGQSSAMLHSFALSNAIIYLEEDKKTVKANEPLLTYLIN